MKKLSYLLTPLLVLPLFASCSGDKPTPKIDYEVNEEEFNSEINLNGVSKLQSHSVFEDENEESSRIRKDIFDYEFSPLIAHEYEDYFISDISSSNPIYKSERYFKIDNIGEEKGKMASKEATWPSEWPDNWSEEVDIIFPSLKEQAPVSVLSKTLKNYKFSLKKEFKYNNFEFKENKYVFKSEVIMSGFELEPLIAEISFENKILKEFNLVFQFIREPDEEAILYSATIKMSYAYEEITPTWPIPENN